MIPILLDLTSLKFIKLMYNKCLAEILTLKKFRELSLKTTKIEPLKL